MRYIYLRDRNELLNLTNFNKVIDEVDTCYLCERDELDRIIGAAVILDNESYLSHLVLIDRRIVSRNDQTRRYSDVPEFDKVKSLRIMIDGQTYSLYHRTHLIPFRFCLDDGNLRNLLFTATARLNSGLRIEDHYIPEKFQIDDNVEQILKQIELDKTYFEDFETTKFLSLADFERAVSCILFREKDDVFKYSVECLYDGDCKIVSSVKVRLIDLTRNELKFSAILKNSL